MADNLTLLPEDPPTIIVPSESVETRAPSPGHDPLDFDAMFAELTQEPPSAPEPKSKPAKAAPAPAPEPPAAETPQVETPQPAASPEAPVREPEPARRATRDDDELLNRFAEIVHARGPQTQQPQAPPPEVFTADERKAIEQYYKDWPDVAKAESIQRSAEYKQVVGYVFNEVASTIRPLLAQIRALEERVQLTDLYAAEPEYNTLRDQVVNWIDTQPAYLKPAYEYVRDQGTAEQVADLIRRYKQETGVHTNGSGNGAALTPTPTPEPQLTPAARKAAAALAPVGSKRSVVVQADDPNNFDAAFDKWAKEI